MNLVSSLLLTYLHIFFPQIRTSKIYSLGGGLVAKLCPTSATPRAVACQAPLSVGFLQARILEWVAILFSIYFLSRFQIYNMVLLTMVTTLHITLLELVYVIVVKFVHFDHLYPIPCFSPSTCGHYHSGLCFYEFFFKIPHISDIIYSYNIHQHIPQSTEILENR